MGVSENVIHWRRKTVVFSIKQHDDPPEAQNALEKIVKKKIQFTEAETIQQAPSKSEDFLIWFDH